MNMTKRYLYLVDKLNTCSRQYYVDNKPSISDTEWDELYHELLYLEEKWGNKLPKVDSPSKRIGHTIEASIMEKVSLKYRMLSLENCFDEKGISNFVKATKAVRPNCKYYVEDKLDGLAIELYYKRGKLIRAATRGDGYIGENVTHTVRTIKNIPKTIAYKDELLIYGEVVVHYDDFKQFNLERIFNGGTPYSHPRSLAAGGVRQLDVEKASKTPLSFYAYKSVCHEITSKLGDSKFVINYIEELGFKTPKMTIENCENELGLIKMVEAWENRPGKNYYPVDGLVIKVLSLRDAEALGEKAKVPRWAIAYKFKETEYETRINSITLQVGRTGVITPVAELEPVDIDGVKVSRATLNNFDFIKKMGVGLGDKVSVKRAGEVIPNITKVISKASVKTYKPPLNCPKCDTCLEKEAGLVKLVCPNFKCSGRLLAQVCHFVSRSALNIVGLGKETVKDLIEQDALRSVAGVYGLNRNILTDRWGKSKEITISNLLENIRKRKHVGLGRFIYALGIDGIGQGSASKIAKRVETLDEFLKFETYKLEFLSQPARKGLDECVEYVKRETESMLDYGLVVEDEVVEKGKKLATASKLNDATVVITGTLPVSRTEAKSFLEGYGVKVSSALSGKTSFLLCGEKAGSKLTKAEKLGVKILTWDDVNAMIGGAK